jgi:ribosomal protein S12 methylthiotransferase accessory factor
MGRAFAAAGDYQPEVDYSDVTTLPQHGLSHAVDPRLRSSIAFLAQPTDIVKLHELRDAATGSPTTDLRTTLDVIKPFVTDVVGIDVTTSDVDEVGFKVVRVVVPELQPMDINHRYRHLGGQRLYDVPWKLGLLPRHPDERTLNAQPHPFP